MLAARLRPSFVDEPDSVVWIDGLTPHSLERSAPRLTLDGLDDGLELDLREHDDMEPFHFEPVLAGSDYCAPRPFWGVLGAFIFLVFVGAGAAALVFHARLSQLL